MRIDVGELIKNQHGAAYAHEYDGFLGFFTMLGNATDEIVCTNVPWSWAPFITWLGHRVESVSPVTAWGVAEGIAWPYAMLRPADLRRVVEMSSTARPELVHGLYLADTCWPCPRRVRVSERAFVVTCNGSFFRPEVLAYIDELRRVQPPARKVVFVPCSAQKPYPSLLHAKVRERLPSDWYIAIATGVLGLIPENMWGAAPLYDSGLPNLDRCRQTVAWWMTKHKHERAVVFSDFYAYAIRDGLRDAGVTAPFIVGGEYRDTYENLMLTEHLDRLERAVRA